MDKIIKDLNLNSENVAYEQKVDVFTENKKIISLTFDKITTNKNVYIFNSSSEIVWEFSY